MIYGVLVLICAFFLTVRVNEKLKITLISISTFIVLGFRDSVGYDFHQYVNLYEERFLPKEYLAKLVYKFSFIFEAPASFFLIYAFLTCIFVWLSALKVNKVSVVVLYVLIPLYYIESFTIVRQGLAIAVAMYSYSLYIEKDKSYFFWLIMVPFFHLSAVPYVLFFSALVLVGEGLRLWVIFLVVMLGLGMNELYPLLTEVIPKLSWYQGENTYGNKYFLMLLMLTGASIVTMYREKPGSIGIYLVLTGLFLFYVLQQLDAVLIRSVYFFFIPFLFYNWSKVCGYLRIHKALWFTVFGSIFWVAMEVKSGWMLPYKFYFW